MRDPGSRRRHAPARRGPELDTALRRAGLCPRRDRRVHRAVPEQSAFLAPPSRTSRSEIRGRFRRHGRRRRDGSDCAGRRRASSVGVYAQSVSGVSSSPCQDAFPPYGVSLAVLAHDPASLIAGLEKSPASCPPASRQRRHQRALRSAPPGSTARRTRGPRPVLRRKGLHRSLCLRRRLASPSTPITRTPRTPAAAPTTSATRSASAARSSARRDERSQAVRQGPAGAFPGARWWGQSSSRTQLASSWSSGWRVPRQVDGAAQLGEEGAGERDARQAEAGEGHRPTFVAAPAGHAAGGRAVEHDGDQEGGGGDEADRQAQRRRQRGPARGWGAAGAAPRQRRGERQREDGPGDAAPAELAAGERILEQAGHRGDGPRAASARARDRPSRRPPGGCRCGGAATRA